MKYKIPWRLAIEKECELEVEAENINDAFSKAAEITAKTVEFLAETNDLVRGASVTRTLHYEWSAFDEDGNELIYVDEGYME